MGLGQIFCFQVLGWMTLVIQFKNLLVNCGELWINGLPTPRSSHACARSTCNPPAKAPAKSAVQKHGPLRQCLGCHLVVGKS